jgi:lipid A 3-O-deacylase
MSQFRARGPASGRAVLVRSLGAAVALAVSTIPAMAQPPTELEPFFAISEVRVGALAANLDGGNSEKATYLINGEVLFRQFDGHYSDAFREVFLRPRPSFGVTLSPEGGTNQLYGGLTWEVPLGKVLFLEASFGGVVHDGPTGASDSNSYGCPVLFRESASVGINITEHVRVMAEVEHMSNAGLCDQNQGLTNAGVRIGYRW